MAAPVEHHPKEHHIAKPEPISSESTKDEKDEKIANRGDEEDDEFEEEEVDVEDEDEDEDEENEEKGGRVATKESKLLAEKGKLENLLHRMSTEKVALRVHDILIKGNAKTRESLIEAELEPIKKASNMQELLQASGIANSRLQQLGIFDSVNITLDSGPPELPGTANVIVEVSEAKNPLTGDVGIFTKPEARSWSLEGSLKWKNLFGYGDIWDGSLAYGWDQTSELSAGISLPRFKGLLTPMLARVYLLSQDWLKFSSYKERSLGMSLSLILTRHHDLAYNLAWRSLTDPSQMSSSSVRKQLGHGLLSSLKYTFKVDQRNSPLRPTRGYAFVSTSQIGGLVPDHRSLRFLRQELDLRFAFPLGFYGAALNCGISSGVIFPWGKGSLTMPSSLPDRFFLGGNSSPVCTLGGPATLLGFKCRGLGPTEPRREIRDKSDSESIDSSRSDAVGGDFAVTAFADISFDLPLKLFRDSGIHGHAFACAGNLVKLTEDGFRNLSVQKFKDTFRTSAGLGIIVPTKLFRIEVNYCYILKQLVCDRGKTGVQFCFSSPM